ncbi:flavin-containing monooxygenase [Kineococcus rubinsiae]|uniref:flavin-containing monooxygenase n=1 Tax=Kineococcus rubinsiae TaxID=2609562 RepID=UPI00143117B6|nr:NAD(P)/FAD-dependent oxidoreductase [Kineococcus rubinsiae]NIZ90901.1 NAD(P)/FAD-dependent oxidoreductase [Kineococcus rubinsiae]
MKIAVVGAGPSGLSTAAVLQQFGHDVVVFEKAPDVGGVWSATRAYPDVATQDDRVSYAFSDVPHAGDAPVHPTGAHVRAYLERYAQAKGIAAHVRCGTRVVAAAPGPDGGWLVDVVDAAGPARHAVDWLVVASGVFSTPHVPAWPGRAEFEAAGGRVVEPTQLGDGAVLAGRDVVVVGWGKTACDVAVATARTARSTTVVARAVRWKIPKRIVGGLTFRHLLLTRLGEHVMAPERTSPAARLLAVGSLPLRRASLWWLEQVIARRTGLRAVGLLPDVRLPQSDSLVTDGFFEAVAQGRVAVRRERSVAALEVVDGVPGVRLSDGARVPADVVVAATGFDQELSVFGPAVQAALLDEDGVLALHRRILPLDVPQLAFAGWGNTYRSPLSAEVGAVWLAGHLAGVVPLPGRAEFLRTAERYHLTHAQAAAHGQPQLPSGSFAALDQLLDDLGLPLPVAVRRGQWTRPLQPASYADLVPRLRERLAAPARSAGSTPAPQPVR